MARYTHKFMVSGRGRFPIDMLRYDQCFPCESANADNITDVGDWREVREVTLQKHSDRRYWKPTYGRWESFGWSVVRVGANVQHTYKVG